jgi:hypothetical protein
VLSVRSHVCSSLLLSFSPVPLCRILLFVYISIGLSFATSQPV